MIMLKLYKKLLNRFGRQGWWPVSQSSSVEEKIFEIMIGAILTQQTTWRNTEKVIKALKDSGLLDPFALSKADTDNVERIVRPIGFYKQKARRIVKFSRHIIKNYEDIKRIFDKPLEDIRKELLSLEGIGPETADNMLLFAGNKLIFPVDAYTFRIFERFGMAKGKLGYDGMQSIFHQRLPKDLEVYKELRGLLVKLGKTCCQEKPKCRDCPLAECGFRKMATFRDSV